MRGGCAIWSGGCCPISEARRGLLEAQLHSHLLASLPIQVAGTLSTEVKDASETCSKKLAALQSEVNAVAGAKADKVGGTERSF